MSQFDPPPPPPPPSPPSYGAGQPAPQTNGLGIAGFILSLLGLISCGFLSPLGLLLSFIAIFRQPRGLAIAGLVLGILGSLWIFIVFFFVGVGLLVGSVGLVAGAIGLSQVEAGLEMYQIDQAIREYEAATGALPMSIDQLSGLDQDDRTDPWGNPYTLEIDPDTGARTIRSLGPDGQAGTDDDIEFDVGAGGEFSFDAPPESAAPPQPDEDAAGENDPI